MLPGLRGRLGDVDLDPLLDFFESERGQRIVEGEVCGAACIPDDGVEEAAGAAGTFAPTDPERYGLLEAFVEANDLVESNVMGAMNSNYAFYQGLMEGGAFDESLTEQEILADMWSQEDQIRGRYEEWVYSYLASPTIR
jgi:hypothetical protein